MVPNGHESTYIFFKCLIHLGLFRPEIGFIRKINIFLYHWDPDAKAIKDKRRKSRRDSVSKANVKTKTRK